MFDKKLSKIDIEIDKLFQLIDELAINSNWNRIKQECLLLANYDSSLIMRVAMLSITNTCKEHCGKERMKLYAVTLEQAIKEKGLELALKTLEGLL